MTDRNLRRARPRHAFSVLPGEEPPVITWVDNGGDPNRVRFIKQMRRLCIEDGVLKLYKPSGQPLWMIAIEFQHSDGMVQLHNYCLTGHVFWLLMNSVDTDNNAFYKAVSPRSVLDEHGSDNMMESVFATMTAISVYPFYPKLVGDSVLSSDVNGLLPSQVVSRYSDDLADLYDDEESSGPFPDSPRQKRSRTEVAIEEPSDLLMPEFPLLQPPIIVRRAGSPDTHALPLDHVFPPMSEYSAPGDDFSDLRFNDEPEQLFPDSPEERRIFDNFTRENAITPMFSRRRGGAFFPYDCMNQQVYDICKSVFDLFGVRAPGADRKLEESSQCFVNSFKVQWGVLTEEEKSRAKVYLHRIDFHGKVTFIEIKRFLNNSNLRDVCVRVARSHPSGKSTPVYITSHGVNHSKPKIANMRIIDLCLIDSHFAPEIPIAFDLWCRVLKDCPKNRKKRPMGTRTFLEKLINQGDVFKEIPMEEIEPFLRTDRGKMMLECDPKTFFEEYMCDEEQCEIREIRTFNVEYDLNTMFAADFESALIPAIDDKGRKIQRHAPYMICAVCLGTKKRYCESGPGMFTNLIRELWKDSKTQPTLLFHNLKYDGQLLFQELGKVYRCLEKGRKMLTIEAACYQRGDLTFKARDTLAILQCKLANTIDMYWPPSERDTMKRLHAKEVFPYTAVTSPSTVWVDEDICVDALSTVEDKNKFLDNVNRLGFIRYEDSTVNLFEYCKYYCMRDCELLAAAWEKARAIYKTSLGIDINAYITIPSIAFTMMTNSVFAKDHIVSCYGFSGRIRDIEQRSLVGGRCMTRDNESWWYTKETGRKWCDFDAVSLYPSAIARLYEFRGKAKRIPEEWRNDCHGKVFKAYESGEIAGFTILAYFMNVNNDLHFPLISSKDAEGRRCWTNKPTKEPRLMNEIDVEMYMKFHMARVYVLDGYYWEEKTYYCKDTITDMFNTRKKEKELKNPVEVVYKLLMNSAYGKSVMRRIASETKYVAPNDLYNYVMRYLHQVDCFFPVTEKLCGVRVEAEDRDNPFPNWWGTRVLSMSKMIMAEVMCLAEELNIDILYTDTDSMIIDQTKLGVLSNSYFKLYHRKLIGNEMGQFHSDFDLPDSWADEVIICDKKIYGAHLVNPAGQTAYHLRGKGIPRWVIEEYDKDDKLAFYKEFWNTNNAEGKKMKVPTADATRPRFVFNRQKTVLSQEDMPREIACRTTIRHIFDHQ